MFSRTSPLTKILLVTLLMLGVSACGGSPTATPTQPPTASPTPLPTATLTPQPDSPIYIVDTAASTIDYVATGAFGIQLPGKFSLLGNTVGLVPDGDGFRVKIDILIDGNSVTAINGLVRDALRGSLEVSKFPTGHFVAESKETIKPEADAVKITASGTLELHGQTKPIEMEITLSVKDGKLDGVGQTQVDLLDFGVNVPTAVLSSKVTFKATIVAQEGDVAAATTAATAPATAAQ